MSFYCLQPSQCKYLLFHLQSKAGLLIAYLLSELIYSSQRQPLLHPKLKELLIRTLRMNSEALQWKAFPFVLGETLCSRWQTSLATEVEAGSPFWSMLSMWQPITRLDLLASMQRHTMVPVMLITWNPLAAQLPHSWIYRECSLVHAARGGGDNCDTMCKTV